jgi:hypothetical protein
MSTATKGANVEQERPEPRARTLILFGIGLATLIIGIIVVAAIIGS